MQTNIFIKPKIFQGFHFSWRLHYPFGLAAFQDLKTKNLRNDMKPEYVEDFRRVEGKTIMLQ